MTPISASLRAISSSFLFLRDFSPNIRGIDEKQIQIDEHDGPTKALHKNKSSQIETLPIRG